MYVVDCSNWADFKRKLLKRHYDPDRKWLYRGVREANWHLESSQARANLTEASATALLERFKNLATGTEGYSTSGWVDYDWWSLGRHHGLATPLLDWSRSPYIAAFFAFDAHAAKLICGYHQNPSAVPKADNGHRVAVWRLFRNVPDDCAFKIHWRRRDDARRQKAQAAVFTELRHTALKSLDRYLKSIGRSNDLTKFTIPGVAYKEALGELRLMNITHATLFSDLSGAAIQANIDEVVHKFMAG